jgi:pyruvate-formate lyase-activating enzyme
MLQSGIGSPISIVISPTNACNTNCAYCCFKNRDKSLEQGLPFLKESLKQFWDLGVRAVEITGGGEPTMYEEIDGLISYCHATGFKIGMNTNGYLWRDVTSPELLTWVRLSLNFLDTSENTEHMGRLVAAWKSKLRLSAGYVVTRETLAILPWVIRFANLCELPTRIVPDSIKEEKELHDFLDIINGIVLLHPSGFCFVERIDQLPKKRSSDFCANHFAKPFLYTDGYVYPCPSMELSVENNHCVDEKLRVCYGTDVYNYYTEHFDIFNTPCRYCKYANQNELLSAVMQETEFNEFV